MRKRPFYLIAIILLVPERVPKAHPEVLQRAFSIAGSRRIP